MELLCSKFDTRKDIVLASLGLLLEEYNDKSPKGFMDKPIISLVEEINSRTDFYTTSSCSGRVCLFLKRREVSKGGKWLLCSHDPVTFEQVQAAVSEFTALENKEDFELTFRFEPFIVHLEARDLESASRFMVWCKEVDIDDIMMTTLEPRVMLRFAFHERITVPLNNKEGLIVTKDFLSFLTEQSTRKFEANFLQLSRFREHLANQNASGDPRGKRRKQPNILFTAKRFKIVSKGLKFKKCGFCRATPIEESSSDPEASQTFVLLEKKMRKPDEFRHALMRLRLGQVIEIEGRESEIGEPDDCIVIVSIEFIGTPDRTQDVMSTGDYLCNAYVCRCVNKEMILMGAPEKCIARGCKVRHIPNQRERAKILRRIARKQRRNERVKNVYAQFAENGDHAVAPWKERGSRFADWIVDTYGLEYLSSGPILDVAGGKGELTLLLMQKSLSSIVIDPRKQKLSKAMRKQCKKDNIPPPTRIRKILESPLTDPELIDLVDTCSLVIGLHPDQATGSIVQVASERGKPFAVVPCCVFSAEFPDRKLLNGSFVHSFEELCQWLTEQSSAPVEKDEMKLTGKNLVLFTRP